MKEVWKDIPGYEGIYEVSNTGLIKRLSSARGTTVGYIFTPSPGGKGYLQTRLTDKNGKARTTKIHRIVCAVFHPNPNNLPQVNHKDTNKANNHADNLEWCTNQANKDHAMSNGIIPMGWKGKFGSNHNKSIPIWAKNIDTGEVKKFIGINETARQLKTNSSAIWRVLKGEWQHTKGWTFQRL